MKKYIRVTISPEERLALETAIGVLIRAHLDKPAEAIEKLLERSKHIELPKTMSKGK